MRPALHQVLANLVTPEHGGSPNANEIDSLYKILLYVAAFVFVAVEGTLLYSLIRFRARKGLIPAQIRGNTNLEISWTVAAALILVVLTAVTFAKLSGIKNPARSGPAGLFAAGGHLYASVDQYRAWVSRQLQLIQQANQEAVQQARSESPIPG